MCCSFWFPSTCLPSVYIQQKPVACCFSFYDFFTYGVFVYTCFCSVFFCHLRQSEELRQRRQQQSQRQRDQQATASNKLEPSSGATAVYVVPAPLYDPATKTVSISPASPPASSALPTSEELVDSRGVSRAGIGENSDSPSPGGSASEADLGVSTALEQVCVKYRAHIKPFDFLFSPFATALILSCYLPPV